MKLNCLMLLLTFTLSTAHAEPILSLAQGQAYQMTYTGKHWVSRVLVTPDSAFNGKTIHATVKGVANGTRSDPALNALFAAPYANIQSGQLASFDITTNDGVDVPHGTYSISIDLSSGKTRQALQLQLTVPPALVSPSRLVITHVLPFWGIGARDVLPRLVVQENGGQSPAVIRIADFPQFSDASGETGGSVVTKAGSLVVPKGDLATLGYDLQGDFPLGTTTATLTLKSDQLDAPAILAMEVHTRRTPWLLISFVALGLILGFLLRTVLKQQIQLGEAQQQASAEYKKLQEEMHEAADKQYKSDINVALHEFRRVIERTPSAPADALSNAVKKAEEALKDATDHLQKRTDDVNTLLSQIATAVGPAWSVPEPAKSALVEARSKLVTARETLKQGDVEKAQTILEQLVIDLDARVTSTARSYRQAYDEFLNNLDTVGRLLLAEQKGYLVDAEKQLTKLRDDIPTVADPAAKCDATKCKGALDAITQAASAAYSLLRELSNSAIHTFAVMDEYLAATPLPKPNEWVHANESTRALALALPDVLDDLRDGPEKMRKDTVALLQEWRTALLAQANVKAVSAFFDQGKYEEAAQLVARTLATPAPAPQRRRGGEEGEEEETSEVQRFVAGESVDASLIALAGSPRFRLKLAPSQQQVLNMGDELIYLRRTLDPVHAMEVHSFWNLLAAKAVQWLICAIGLTIIGYLLFADKFVGTPPEILTAFFWGFSTDVGVDSLVSAAKPKTGS